jgi:hypothetical protein
MIRRFSEDRECKLFVDLHGHSRKLNTFIYGCENKTDALLRLKVGGTARRALLLTMA